MPARIAVTPTFIHLTPESWVEVSLPPTLDRAGDGAGRGCAVARDGLKLGMKTSGAGGL